MTELGVDIVPDATWLRLVVSVGLVVLVLLALAGWARWRRRCRVGPIDVVVPLNGTDEPDTEARPAARAAEITARLAGGDLFPAPAVPSGAMATGFIDVVETSPLPQARWLGTLLRQLRVILSWRPPGFRLTGTLLRRPSGDQRGFAAQLFPLGSPRDPAVHTFWYDSYERAAEAVAGFAYATAIRARDRRCTPIWRSWMTTDGISVTHYQRGLEAEHEADATAARAFRRQQIAAALDPKHGLPEPEEKQLKEDESKIAARREAALEEYGKAASAEPDQALVRMRIANLHERKADWASALLIYLSECERWPLMFDARYRFAIVLGFAEDLSKDFKALADGYKRKDLVKRMKARCPEVDLNKPSTIRKYALIELERLHSDISRWRLLRLWLTTWWPCGNNQRERHELGALAKPMSRIRRLRRQVVKTAEYCTRLQVKASDDTTPSPKAISKRLRCGRVKNWQVRYNVACCYSRYMEHNPGSLSTKIKRRGRPLIQEAMHELERAYRKAEGHLELSWILRDPDPPRCERAP